LPTLKHSNSNYPHSSLLFLQSLHRDLTYSKPNPLFIHLSKIHSIYYCCYYYLFQVYLYFTTIIKPKMNSIIANSFILNYHQNCKFNSLPTSNITHKKPLINSLISPLNILSSLIIILPDPPKITSLYHSPTISTSNHPSLYFSILISRIISATPL
jgi:hypothetical protein